MNLKFYYTLFTGDKMDISRKLGILVFCGVPAIIGGGILFWIFGNYVPVFIFEFILLLFAGSFFS